MRAWRPAACRQAAAALLCLVAAPGTAAQEQRTGLAATDLFALADQARAGGQVEDALAYYDALARDPDPEIRAEARFRKGMTLAAARRYSDAAVTFRQLLDERPNAARVRLELARVLALLGDDAGARRAVRQAQAIGLPDDVAVNVDQFARALRSTKPLGGSFEIALAPDSNVNRATQARTLDTIIAPLTLSRDAQARSGVGLDVAGQGYARLALTDHLSLLPRASALGNLYRQSEFDDISASALLGLEWQHGADKWSPSAGATWRWYGGAPYARTISGTLDWLHSLGRRAQLIVHGGAADVTYRRNALQDGDLFDASIGYERALTARAGASISLSGYRQAARDPGYAVVAGGPTLSTWWDRRRTTLSATLGLSRLEGDERLALFYDRRREWLLSTSIGATLRQFTVRGLAPTLRLSAERNWSTVDLYAYRRLAADVGVSRAF